MEEVRRLMLFYVLATVFGFCFPYGVGYVPELEAFDSHIL
jgi:hypothetical protein